MQYEKLSYNDVQSQNIVGDRSIPQRTNPWLRVYHLLSVGRQMVDKSVNRINLNANDRWNNVTVNWSNVAPIVRTPGFLSECICI